LKNSIKRRVDLKGLSGMFESNHVLFLERLESAVSEDCLEDLFGLYPGFKEVRLISEKGVAFVEFYEAASASVALAGLNGFKVSPTCQFFITYAKKDS
jgi:U2 small nuclear ribonucleoprotein B''